MAPAPEPSIKDRGAIESQGGGGFLAAAAA